MAVAEAMSRPVIDLTTEPTTPRAPRSSIGAFVFPPQPPPPPPREEPPTKRRRVDNASPRKVSLKDFLRDQVAPHVNEALRKLPPQGYRVNAIALEAIAALASTTSIRIRLDETGGRLLPKDVADIARRARELVGQLALLPQFQVHPPRPPPPPSSPFTPLLRDQQHAGATHRYLLSTKKYIRTSRPSRAHSRSIQTQTSEPSQWSQLKSRPYVTARDRALIATGIKKYHLAGQLGLSQPTVIHVDFTTDELERFKRCVSQWLPNDIAYTHTGISRAVALLGDGLPELVAPALPGRSRDDIRNLCLDVQSGQVLPEHRRLLSVRQAGSDSRNSKRSNTRIHSLLLARELESNQGFGRSRQYLNFQTECIQLHEDELSLVAEFTNCAGDIATISWISTTGFICGTTAHSDRHNQQYNKPGNLLTFSALTRKLRAFPDHRIPRPFVETGENSTAAMRQSQDPWLYSSVVSSDYDEAHKLAYTSSFDQTVKVWKMDDLGHLTSMATWRHKGNVNFVVAAKDGSGRVASAADIPSEAVRVYTINPESLGKSPYQTLSCTRTDANGSDKWAYFPATMQWGRAPGTQHLLAIGYSPRSLLGDDNDIPEDKRQSGEIMLWDSVASRRIPVLTATTANVFEIAWHPTQARFIVATSPCGLNVEHGVRTQIHIFQPDRARTDGAYHEFQNLDCTASDINEITIMPNSVRHAYVTAACTDGRVYVWDTAQGDRPIHALKHGQPLDEVLVDREKEDTGVKFTAWGTTPDRLYTGGSDGVVKVWNIRKKNNPFVRVLLKAPGPVSCGSFLEDHSRLAIGDATGRVFVFSLDSAEAKASLITIPGLGRLVRRPQPYVPHADPPPPEKNMSISQATLDAEVNVGAYARQVYLDSAQVIIHPNPVIGAVQGPNYKDTGLYRLDAHRDGDPTAPLLTFYDRLQQLSIHAGRGRRRSVRRLRTVGPPSSRLEEINRANKGRDLDPRSLDDAELADLLAAGAEFTIDEDWGFAYDDMPARLS